LIVHARAREMFMTLDSFKKMERDGEKTVSEMVPRVE